MQETNRPHGPKNIYFPSNSKQSVVWEGPLNVKLQIISGTNRPGNLSIGVARQYQSLLNDSGLSTELLSLESLATDFVATDLYGKRSPAFQEVQQQILETRHFLFVVPEYNGSIPGILKLFIDACDYPDSFKGKEVWSVGVSAGLSGNRNGLKHLRDIMTYCGSKVHRDSVFIPRIGGKIDDQGWVVDSEIVLQIQQQLAGIRKELIPA